MYRLILIVPLLAFAPGCPETGAGCLDGLHQEGDDGINCVPNEDAGPQTDTGPDVTMLDTGTDAPDAGPCPDGCGGTTPMCDTVNNRCVACLGHEQCTDADMARCDSDTGMCALCDDPVQCAGVPGDPVACNAAGTCVACTPETEETDCGDFSCNPETFECTLTETNSLSFCEACVSDSECISAETGEIARCIQMDFSGDAHGSYCLLDQTTLGESCPIRQISPRVATSVGGVESTYCFIRDNLTTCEAVIGFGRPCPLGDSECGDLTLEDSVCVGARCSYACVAAEDCGSESCSGAPNVCQL